MAQAQISARRPLFAIAVTLFALVCIVTAIPLTAEIVSAFTGQHVWTMESLEYAVAPIVAIVVAVLLILRIMRAKTSLSAAAYAVASIVILVLGCAPLDILFGSLLAGQLRQ